MLYWLVANVCYKCSAKGYNLFRRIKERKPLILQVDCLVDTWVGKERGDGYNHSFLFMLESISKIVLNSLYITNQVGVDLL